MTFFKDTDTQTNDQEYPTGYSFTVKGALDAYSKKQKKTFTTDRSLTVGASEVGKCLRQTWFKKKGGVSGFEQDVDANDSTGAADRGTVYENEIWYPALKEERPRNSRLLFAGPYQESLVDGYLSATPDGLLANLYRGCLEGHPALAIKDIGSQSDDQNDVLGCLLVECKTIDPRVNLKGQPKPEHRFQQQAQMGIIRTKTQFRPNYSIITYTDASFFDRVEEFITPFDPMVYDAAKARAWRIMTTNDPASLPAEGKDTIHAKECETCAFKQACAAVSVSAMPAPEAKAKLSVEQDDRLTALAEEAKSQAAREADAETAKKAAQSAIKELLREVGARKVKTSNGYSIAWSSQAGRKSYDMDALSRAATDAGIDITNFEKPAAAFDKLLVTAPKA